jgi:hypothetical protein
MTALNVPYHILRRQRPARHPETHLSDMILLALLFFLVMVALAWAATTATITLTGSMAQRLDITITPTGAASTLDLSVNQPVIKVGDMNARSNNRTGYNIGVSSANVAATRCASPCFYSTSQAESLAFSLYRDATAISFSGATGTFINKATRSAGPGDPYAVQVSYDGSAANLAASNDYAETLTFTIAVN